MHPAPADSVAKLLTRGQSHLEKLVLVDFQIVELRSLVRVLCIGGWNVQHVVGGALLFLVRHFLHDHLAVAHLDGPESFPIDIGKVTFMRDGTETVRYFPNIAEVGLGAATVARAESLPRWLGPTIYFFAFWLTLRKHKRATVKVDLVDRVYEGPMNNLVVANGQFFGGGMKVAPKAAPTDGLLDVQIEHARKREAIALVPRIYKGEHVPHPDIEESKRARLSITADRPLPVEADGEVLGETPASFEVLRDAIRLKV